MSIPAGSDLLLTRDRAAILAEILAARSAYVPDWLPAEGGAAHGLAQILAGHLEMLQERLRQLPAHRQAVLLDMLGVSLLPAQGARTHVLLTAVPGTRAVRVPKGARIGANVVGRDAPVVFETQRGIAISPATLVEVHSVHPAADAERDHSADVLAGRPFTLFAGLTRVDRALYVGHDELLAFDGRAVVGIEIGVGRPAPHPLRMEWAWWDGHEWRAFAPVAPSALEAGDDDSVDGTDGLTHSGTVHLVAPEAAAEAHELDGRRTYWIRATLTAPLDLPVGAELPTVARLRLTAVNEHRRLRVQRTPDAASWLRVWWPERPAGGVSTHVLDVDAGARVDSPIAPGGRQPLVGLRGPVRLGVSLTDSRPGGTMAPDAPRRVALDTDDDLTPPLLAAGASVDVVVDRGLPLDKGIADSRAVDLSKTFAPLGPAPDRGTAFHFACATATRRPGSRVTLLIERPETAAERADKNADLQRDAARATDDKLTKLIDTLEFTVKKELEDALGDLNPPLPELRGKGLIAPGGNVLRTAVQWFAEVRAPIEADIAAVQALLNGVEAENRQTHDDLIGPVASGVLPHLVGPGLIMSLDRAVTGLDAAEKGLDDLVTLVRASVVRDDLLTMDPTTYVTLVKNKITSATNHVKKARDVLAAVIPQLRAISPAALAVELARKDTTTLALPEVAWEYHDGTRWRALGVVGDDRVRALLDSGSLHFTVPGDIADVDVDGDVRRWLRARLAAGTYAHMSLVSWTDTLNTVNFLPVVEPRAPLVDRIEVFYTHTSPGRDADAVVAHDVHEWRDLTAAVRWPGPGVAPFVPMPEQAATLYLGLDGELPADTVTVWFQPADPSPWAEPRHAVWEGWDGLSWVRLGTDDGTDGLRRTGVVALLWPGTDRAPGATVSGALGSTVTLLGRGAAQRFAPGDRLMLADRQGQEPVVVATAEGETVRTRDPVSRAYTGARLVTAPPARFGAPRTWIRAVFDPTRPPPELRLDRVAAHGVEVAQVETLRDEVLGSGDGSPGQVLVARRFPVAADAELEVRELQGERADLDAVVLERTLAAEAVDLADVRVMTDDRTGRVTEVWVPWTAVPSLGAAGPRDRVYALDHAQGRFLFGGGGRGAPLPEGRDNVRLHSYRTTEGTVGNVAAGALDKLLSAVAVGEVRNPEPASGGADVESLPAALGRGPALVRHRRLALTEADVEAIAVESSPAVVRARAVGARDRFGRPAPGAVRVVVQSRDGTDRPVPGPALLATVRDAVLAASPAVAARRVTVEGPSYLPVGVSVTVVPLRADAAGTVRERVAARLEALLHPLRGAPSGAGWDFGAAAQLSDVARVLKSVPGVDAVTDLTLTVDGAPAGDVVLVPPDRVVCAGPVVVRLAGGV